MVHYDGGLRHVAQRHHNPKLFVQFLDVGINGILPGRQLLGGEPEREVVWLRQPGAVQQRMTEGASNQGEELPDCLRRARSGDPPRIVLLPDCPAAARLRRVLRPGQLRAVLRHGNNVAGQRPVLVVIFQVKPLFENALHNRPNRAVRARSVHPIVRLAGVWDCGLEGGNNRGHVEAVEVEPAWTADDGSILPAIVILDAVGKIDQVDDSRIAYIDAPMTGIHRVIDRRAIRRGVYIGDERLARGRLRWVLCRNGLLREKNGGGGSEKKSDGGAEDIHKDLIEKRSSDEVVRLRRSETRLDQRTNYD